jgi:hypothetical protein
MNGNVIDLNFLSDHPEDDIADDLVQRRMNNDQGIGNRPVLDLSFERAFVPGIGKRNLFDLQNRRNVTVFHPPEKIKFGGQLFLFYFFSSA